MLKQSLPPVSILTPDNFEDFLKADKVVIVGFFDAEDTKSNETFLALAKAQRDDFVFGAISDASIAEKEGVKRPGVIMYKSFDDPKTISDATFEQTDLESWTKTFASPIIGAIPVDYGRYVDSGLPLAFIFVEPDSIENFKKELNPVARKFRGKVNFVTVDSNQYGRFANTINLYLAFLPYLM
jgi:protein disulfide-isomerase A1